MLLRRWREREGLSLRAAARRFECTEIFIADVERGRKRAPAYSRTAFKMFELVRPDRAVDRLYEDLLWDLTDGRRNQQVAIKATQAVLSALASPVGDWHAVSDALVDAAQAGDLAEVTVEGDRMRLSGAAASVYAWPRSVLIDFLLETTDELVFRFHSASDPHHTLIPWDGQLGVRIRPEFADERAPWVREHFPDLMLTTILDYEPAPDGAGGGAER